MRIPNPFAVIVAITGPLSCHSSDYLTLVPDEDRTLCIAGKAVGDSVDVPEDFRKKLASLVCAAVADLASRERIEEAKVEILSLDYVEWQLNELDCDLPPRTTSGGRRGGMLLLGIGRRLFYYRLAEGKLPLLCQSAARPPLKPHPHLPNEQ